MKTSLPSLALFCSLTLTCTHAPAQLFDGLFGGDEVGAEEVAANQGPAERKLKQAEEAESSGNARKARDLYKSITKSYPRTDAAMRAKFRYARLLQQGGDEKKAYDEYQELITKYRETPDFKEAIQSQFEIAEKLQNSGDKGFLGLGATIQPSKLIEMYEGIAEAAPYSEFAPKALLNISAVHGEQGDIPAALAALKKVTDTYGGSDYATEAQYRIFRLRGEKAEDSNSPEEDRAQVEAAMDFINQNPEDERADAVQSNLRAIEERSMEKQYNTGLFYEKSGKPESARVYYREVAKNPNTKWAAKAQARLEALDRAPQTVEKKAGLFGGNPLKKDKVEMRTSPDTVVPIPGEEPSE